MKARVKLSPEMMEKLVNGDAVFFRVRPGCDMLELRLVEPDESFSQFDRVFTKLLDKISKLIK